MPVVKQVFAVFQKDIKSEFRTRYTISAVSLFVLTTIAMLVFSLVNEDITPGVASGLLWIVMFFSAMTGLSKSFISEEERGTSLLLKISTTPTAVYFGKLMFNIVLSISLNTLAVLLFLLFVGSVTVKSVPIFIVVLLLGSLGLASATTIISAIIARANTKAAMLPVLSFPVMLPLIIAGIESTRFAFEGAVFSRAFSDFRLIAAYCGVLISISYVLFGIVWEE